MKRVASSTCGKPHTHASCIEVLTAMHSIIFSMGRDEFEPNCSAG